MCCNDDFYISPKLKICSSDKLVRIESPELAEQLKALVEPGLKKRHGHGVNVDVFKCSTNNRFDLDRIAKDSALVREQVQQVSQSQSI